MIVALCTTILALAGGASAAAELTQTLGKYAGVSRGYSMDDVRADWPAPLGPFKMLAPGGSCKVNDGALYGFFPKGQILGHSTGFTWYSELPRPLLQATMTYDVYFDAGFDWKKGGKLPGMCGLDCPVGCSGVSRERGWSTRLMWRENGGMVTYAYYPDKSPAARCGEDWRWSSKVQAGKWHSVRIYAGVNTPGVADGVSRAWLDGALVLDKTAVMYRYRPGDAYAVTRAYITTYAGGSSVDMFAPDHDQYIKFRNFNVYDGEVPPGASTPAPVLSGATRPASAVPPPASPRPRAAGDSFRTKSLFFGGFCAEVSCPGGFTLTTSKNIRTWGMSSGEAGVWRGDATRAGFCFYDAAIARVFTEGDARASVPDAAATCAAVE